MTNYHEYILIAASDQTWLFVEISHPTKKIPIQGIKNPRDILKVKNPESRGFSGFFRFIYSSFSNPDLDSRDFEIFQIFLSGFFRDFRNFLI